MSFKLTKQELGLRNALVEKLLAAHRDLDSAIQEFNTAMETAKAPLKKALEDYNAVMSDVREFAADVANQADSDITEKSEKWQEGEKGQAAIGFRDAWQELADMHDGQLGDLPEELEELDETSEHADALADAPEDANSM